MRRIYPALTALVAVILCGTVHGLWINRWGTFKEPGVSAARLAQVPLSLEDWEGQEIKVERRPGTEMAGELHRRYVHRRTGMVVSVYVVCDRPGPVSIHTPDVCYEASGYEVQSPVTVAPPLGSDAPAAQFRTARFRKKTAADPTFLRIFWSWNAAGAWEVPDDPRWAFAS
ncbi:MAG TPA: exosortase-associated EpsI family protein, partial [Isosphaeraceae bacterium]|nr:exosortase-associated EpsI family protein [Isosphaeraceae bacterium]